MTLLSKILDRLFALLPRRKPNPTCGLMLLWSLPPDKAKILVDYLDAVAEESRRERGEDIPARGGAGEGQTGVEYLEIPDWL
jgi:hypothetical protein